MDKERLQHLALGDRVSGCGLEGNVSDIAVYDGYVEIMDNRGVCRVYPAAEVEFVMPKAEWVAVVAASVSEFKEPRNDHV